MIVEMAVIKVDGRSNVGVFLLRHSLGRIGNPVTGFRTS